MSHDGEHSQLKGMLNLLAKAIGMEWVPCEARNCGSGEAGAGTIRGFYCDDGECETCQGAGKVLKKTEERD